MIRAGKVISVLTRILNRFICLGLAAFVLLLVVRPQLVSESTGDGQAVLNVGLFYDYWVYFVPATVVLLVMNLNIIQFIIFCAWNSNVRRYISSKTTSGTSRVSLDAIERAMKTAASGVPEVEKCRLRVYRIGTKRHKVEVQFWIADECNVLNISEKLRLILKKRFSELVSIEPDERVFFEINLAGITNRKRGAGYDISPAHGPGRKKSGSHFKGPVYPIDGEI